MIARRWVPLIEKACGESRNFEAALKLFDGWDYTMDLKSPAATLFNAFFFDMMKNTLADEIGNDLWEEQLAGIYNGGAGCCCLRPMSFYRRPPAILQTHAGGLI